MKPEDRQAIKDGVFTAGTLLGIIARHTKTPADDKLAKALVAFAMNDALLDKFLDIIDSAIPA